MIQHHLVFHFTSLEDGITYYEANVKAAYYLVRSGKIMDCIEETLGEYAATVMSTVIFLGHAQVSHLDTLPELRRSHDRTTNGVHEDGVDLHAALKALAGHGYINRVREFHFWSLNDNFLEAEKTARSKLDARSKGKKAEEAVRENTEDLLKERVDADISHGFMHDGIPRGAKPRNNNVVESARPNKNKKRDIDTSDDDGMEQDEEDELPETDTIPMDVRMRSTLPTHVLM